jgi:hypothetical protein
LRRRSGKAGAELHRAAHPGACPMRW